VGSGSCVQVGFGNTSDPWSDFAAGPHSNSSGYVVKRSTEGSYDWLYVLDGTDAEYAIKECLAERRSVTLRDGDRI